MKRIDYEISRERGIVPVEIDQSLADIPEPSEKRIALRVSPAGERAIRNGHPWLF